MSWDIVRQWLDAPAAPAARRVEHAIALGLLGYTAVKLYQKVRSGTLTKDIVGFVMEGARSLGAGGALDAAISGALTEVMDEIAPPVEAPTTVIPSKAVNGKEIIDWVAAALAKDEEESGLRSGSAFAGIYHMLTSDLTRMQSELMAMCVNTNLLYPGVFKTCRRMEAEAVAMVVNMLRGAIGSVNADVAPDASGLLTSGGTESIILAMKAYRDEAFHKRGGPCDGLEVICCSTAHPALDKAAEYLRLALIKLQPCEITQKLRVEDVAAHITPNTIAVYASAPTFPHGVIDPIEEIAAVTQRKGVALHVDNCLGGLLLSFAKANDDASIPAFDFRVPGVTSISCDVHKYGQAPKGASIVAFRNTALRRFVYTTVSDWPGGMYTTPTASGSRSAGPAVVAWATLRAVGAEGYKSVAAETMQTHAAIKRGVAAIPELQLVGECTACIVAFTVKPQGGFHIYEIAARMQSKGWHLPSIHLPPAINMCITERFAPVVDSFLADLRTCCEEARKNPGDPAFAGKGGAGIYGTAAMLPATEMQGILRQYCDILYSIRSKK